MQRQGASNMKHLDVNALWLQEREANSDLSVVKIPRLNNWSDLLTHQWTEVEGERHLSGMGVERRERHYGSPARGVTKHRAVSGNHVHLFLFSMFAF